MQKNLRRLQSHNLPMPRNTKRTKRNAQRSHFAFRRAKNRPRPIASFKTHTLSQLVQEFKDLVLQSQKNESHLPRFEHVQVRPEEHDCRVLDTQ